MMTPAQEVQLYLHKEQVRREMDKRKFAMLRAMLQSVTCRYSTPTPNKSVTNTSVFKKKKALRWMMSWTSCPTRGKKKPQLSYHCCIGCCCCCVILGRWRWGKTSADCRTVASAEGDSRGMGEHGTLVA